MTNDKWEIGTIVKMEFLGVKRRNGEAGVKHFHHLHSCNSIATPKCKRCYDFVSSEQR